MLFRVALFGPCPDVYIPHQEPGDDGEEEEENEETEPTTGEDNPGGTDG